MAESGFWDDNEAAQRTIDQLRDLNSTIETYHNLEESIGDAQVMLELAEEEEGFLEELGANLKESEKQMEAFRIESLLSGEFDHNSALLAIHAGVGGLEAQDWAEIMQRMYTRWANSKGYKTTIVDYNSDTEGGIRSVTLEIEGKDVYGYLKGEKGVHRLVRISPFDTSGRRHTSFASVDVFPKLDEDIEIDIDPNDLKIDTYRASGAGGQHVNTTDSAVRITHIPTGVVVQCQSERSQITNRETAMRMLYSRLLQIAEEEQKERIEDIQGSYTQIGWGSQIRSYVYNPYQMVKDHRTDHETGNIEAVVDGDLDPFINEYLISM